MSMKLYLFHFGLLAFVCDPSSNHSIHNVYGRRAGNGGLRMWPHMHWQSPRDATDMHPATGLEPQLHGTDEEGTNLLPEVERRLRRVVFTKGAGVEEDECKAMTHSNMRLLTDDEIIHVPLGYLNKYGEEVPDAVPLLNEENCLSTLTKLGTSQKENSDSNTAKASHNHDQHCHDLSGGCTVCLAEEFEEGDKLIVLPCNHAFHENCAEKWLATGQSSDAGPTCPNCRAPVCETWSRANRRQLEGERFGALVDQAFGRQLEGDNWTASEQANGYMEVRIRPSRRSALQRVRGMCRMFSMGRMFSRGGQGPRGLFF